jgi:tetratricopeptide (TPR) repeat protein
MVSSTVRDLPDHRQGVLDACMRQGMFPLMMEYLPAIDADAIKASMDLVDQADIYLGIFAYRYGYVPKGCDISITEMEYNRAVERGIPRLIFLMHDDHPVKAADVEKGDGAIKLEKFKQRVGQERVINFFKSPEGLRADVINSLSQYRQPDVTAFHYVSDIPAPPEAYIAHPYTLLQSKRLVGRQAELNLLTDWVAKPDSEVYPARILNVVAIGGMGKSALTWKWFNDIAPQEMKPVDGRAWGRMWWSFYESDASFENFITRALAYVTRRPRKEVEKIPPPERESQLLAALDLEPFLIVLDGLERILIAYARMDAAHLSDDDLDQQTANRVAGAIGLPESAAQSFIGQHRLRKTADPRAGGFLRKLASVHVSRILVSTRLYPADLQTSIGGPLPGSFALFLTGLTDDDLLGLWREFKVTGSRDELLALFRKFENHPLLVQALASEVANDRRAPGDFDRWRKAHREFDPFRLLLVHVKSHVLEFALHGLDAAARKLLETIAAFRMPVNHDTLAALLVRSASEPGQKQGVLETLKGLVGEAEWVKFADEAALDKTLADLEDRGLLGWDRRANRYDLHPIVRGVVWSGLDDGAKRNTYGVLETHFRSLPAVDRENVNRLEDLTSAIELYNTLLGLGRYDDACTLFYEGLETPTLHRLSASRQRVELLEMLFPDGSGRLTRLRWPTAQGYALNALAQGYVLSGQPGRAVPLYRMDSAICDREHERRNLAVCLNNLSGALQFSGALRESEAASRQALSVSSELSDTFQAGASLNNLGLSLAARGKSGESKAALERALRIDEAEGGKQAQGLDFACLAKRVLWLGDAPAARPLANRAWQLAAIERSERDFIRAARLQGAAALALDDLATADERLHHALSRARAVDFVEEELPALAELAELRRKQGDLKAARELLDDVWELAERGPYPLFHADALNVLAQIERDAGNRDAAVEAATKAYRLAWCDGPPFAYHWGLEAARAHLEALGAPEPTDLPAYDESKFEPMPEVEINPPDKFGSPAD